MRRLIACGWWVWALGVAMCPGLAPGRDCDSEMGAHLKPIFEDGRLFWAAELTGAQGWMARSDWDRSLRTGMLFLGLGHRFGGSSAHEIYFESGLKYGHTSDDGPGSGSGDGGWGGFPSPGKNHPGLREAFYRFEGGRTTATAGLQSMQMGDFLLLDERALGITVQRYLGSFRVDVHAGTVATDFARMGDFCASRHTYKLVRGGRFNLVSNNLWQTNLAGGMISWSPSYRNDAPDGDTGAASEDEFAFEDVGDAFASVEEGGRPDLVQKAGLVFLEEFGDGFHEYKYYYGAVVELMLPWDLGVKGEVIGQHIHGEKAAGYLAEARRDLPWRSGALTDVTVGYMGRASIDDNVRFYPAFSNLFLGEVVRLDAPDGPFLYASIKQTFPWKLKPSVKAFWVSQTGGSNTRELDLKVGARIYRGLRLNWMHSLVYSDLLEGNTHMNRFEIRWTF